MGWKATSKAFFHMLIHQAGHVHEYLRSKHIPLYLSVSLLHPRHLLLALRPPPFTFCLLLLSPFPVAPCSVRYIVARASSALPSPARPCRAYENPLWNTSPPSNPRAAPRHRCNSDSKKGPREMAPLCAPNLCRAVLPCSFTRSDKSGSFRSLSFFLLRSFSIPVKLLLVTSESISFRLP